MNISRGSALLAAAAVLATAGCAHAARDTGDASPRTTASADSGFGGVGAAAPTSPVQVRTKEPAPTATATTEPEPAEKPKWTRLLEPCPNQGQKVEIQKLIEGDITGDGRADTIIARTCEASTSYWPSTIEVFDGASADPARPQRIGEPLLTERHKQDEPVVTGLSINAGMLGVKAYGTSPKGTRACPDLKLFYRYEHQGDGFKLAWRDSGPGETCE